MKRMNTRMFSVIMAIIIVIQTTLADSGITAYAATPIMAQDKKQTFIQEDSESSNAKGGIIDDFENKSIEDETMNNIIEANNVIIERSKIESSEVDHEETDSVEVITNPNKFADTSNNTPYENNTKEYTDSVRENDNCDNQLVDEFIEKTDYSDEPSEQTIQAEEEQNLPEEETQTDEKTQTEIEPKNNNTRSSTNSIFLRSTGNEYKKIGFAWTIMDITDVSYFEVYRDEAVIATFEATDANEYFYLDRNREEGIDYVYQIEAYNKDDEKLCASSELELCLCEDMTVYNNSDNMEVLMEDMTVNNLILSYGYLDLNGHTLTVLGDVTCYENSRVYFNQGSLICNNMIFDSYLYLYMNEEEDYLCVNNDLDLGEQNYGNVTQLTAGTLEVKGDILANASSFHYCFVQSKTFKTILSGNVKQEMKGLISESYYAYFNQLEIRNYSEDGVVFDYPPIHNAEFETNGCNVSLNLEKYSSGMTLTENTVIEGDYNLGLGELNLNGYTLTIKGDFNQVSGIIYLNKGKLIVEGDYNNCLEDTRYGNSNAKKGSLCSDGLLVMTNAEDYMLVKGNVFIYTRQVRKDVMTAGVLEVQGDFENYGYSMEYFNNVYMTGNSILKMTGDKEQKLIIYSKTNRLANIYLENDEVDYQGTICYTGSLRGSFRNGLQEYSRVIYAGDLDLQQEQYSCNVVLFKPYTISKNILFDEDLYVNNRLFLEADITVNGALNVEGTIDLNGHTIKATSIYIGSKGSLCMDNDESKLIVAGAFVDDSAKNNSVLSAGVIQIGGNFSVKGHDFTTSGTNKVILNGTKQQILDIAYHKFCFASLEVENSNSAGISLEAGEISIENYSNLYMVPFYGYEGNINNGDILSAGYKLENNQVVNGKFVLEDGVLDLNGYSLMVEGDFYHKGGTISVNGGALYINGNYESGLAEGNQIIQMTHEQDIMSVSGDMIVGSNINEGALLTNGNLYLYGNFYQKHKSYKSTENFNSTGKFTLHLCGTEKQIFSPYKDNYAERSALTVSRLVMENTSEQGIEFCCPFRVTTYLHDNQCHKLGTVEIWNTTLLDGSIYQGDLNIYMASSGTWDKDLKIYGNLHLRGGASDTASINARLDVIGDFIIDKAVNITQDCSVSGNIINNNKVTVNARLNVNNNLINNSYFYIYRLTTVGGALENKGELIIYKELDVSGNFISNRGYIYNKGRLLCDKSMHLIAVRFFTDQSEVEPSYTYVRENLITDSDCYFDLRYGTLEIWGDT